MIKKAEFIKSVTKLADCPKDDLREYAFIGRSNVGKSSLINMITGRKKLAKISSKPGKTQTINFFKINDEWRIVDLPGYGWAKVSKEKKIEWSAFVRDYLLHRENLVCLFVLIDIRLEPQAIDLEFIQCAGEKEIPIALVFTKSDKITKNKGIRSVELFKSALKDEWAAFPEIFITSTTEKKGRENLLDYIEIINEG